MAQATHKHPENTSGAWFCTHPDDAFGEGCIACATCNTGAPDFFAADADGNSYVRRQPVTPEEIERCQNQLEACPVGSIGKHG